MSDLKNLSGSPLLCSKCEGSIEIIGFIEDDEIIEKILRHLIPWVTRSHDPPIRKDPYTAELTYDDSYIDMVIETLRRFCRLEFEKSKFISYHVFTGLQ